MYELRWMCELDVISQLEIKIANSSAFTFWEMRWKVQAPRNSWNTIPNGGASIEFHACWPLAVWVAAVAVDDGDAFR